MSRRGKLLTRVERLAVKREALLERLESLEPGRVSEPPAADVWSIGQVVEHMIIAEEYCLLGHLDAHQLEARPSSLRQRLLYEVVVLVLLGPVRVSTPVVEMDPEGTESLEELSERWRRSQTRLSEIVQNVGDPARDAIFRHPIAGPMTAAQAVRMLEVHQRRHIRQIDARLAATAR